MNITKICNFIKPGNEIAENDKQQRLTDTKQSYHKTNSISGKEYAQWMSEIATVL